jgi:ADP-heptose:LPS heptosyltransferase
VLPLAPASSYRFFNSRGKASYPMKASISELTDLWLNAIFDEQESCYPKVWLDESDSAAAASFVGRLRQNEEQQFVAINLGFGGNTRKCLTAAFEAELVMRLLQDPQRKVILDMGFGENETNRIEYILQAAEQAGIPTARTDFASMGEVNRATRLIGIECSIGEISCLIEQSDEFVGYDSACQHIAAALEVPACTVFSGTNNVRFIRRWRASGANISEIVFVDTLSRDQKIDIDEVVTRVLDFRS